MRWEADHRNEVWQGDHKLGPLSASLRALRFLGALREAILLEDGDIVLGGVPERPRIDHGLEFCATAVRGAALAFDIEFSLATE